MSGVFPYTEMLVYVCQDCGFEQSSAEQPEACMACGAVGLAPRDDALDSLQRFVRHGMLPVKGLPIRVAKVPVTQMLWRLVTGTNPARFKGDELPVETVSFDDCQMFIDRLNHHPLVARSEWVYRLPTSNEWETFARRGRRVFGNVAWFWENSDGSPHPVAMKAPNPRGLHDLFGNVWEWCGDVDGNEAVCRGGCWCSDESGCMVVERWPRDARRSFIGLRLCAEGRS